MSKTLGTHGFKARRRWSSTETLRNSSVSSRPPPASLTPRLNKRTLSASKIGRGGRLIGVRLVPAIYVLRHDAVRYLRLKRRATGFGSHYNICPTDTIDLVIGGTTPS